MKSEDEFQPGKFDDWTLERNRMIHRERIKQPKSQTNTSRPKRPSHLVPRAKKRTQQQKDTFSRIEYENQLLLAKMSRIAQNGSGSTGGPPKPTPPKTPKSKAIGGNYILRKQRQERIAKENQELLRRITDTNPEYSTNKFALAERARVHHLSQLGRFRQKPKFVSSLRHCAQTSRSSTQTRKAHSNSYDGVDPARQILSRIQPQSMRSVFGSRPPGSVRTVFSAMMMLVSPFEPNEADLDWAAVREWVDGLGGVQQWLSNLWNFNMSLVPISNAFHTQEFLEKHSCDVAGLHRFNPGVAALLEWIRTVCSSVQPLTERQHVSESDPTSPCEASGAVGHSTKQPGPRVIDAKKVPKKPVGCDTKDGIHQPATRLAKKPVSSSDSELLEDP